MTLLNQGNAARGDTAQQQTPPRRFTRASMEHVEPGGYDETISAAAFGAGPVTKSFELNAHGYVRSVTLLIESDGNGAAGLSNAVAEADAPWSFIKTITFRDVNGGHIFGPVSGFDLFLANKWGGYHHDGNVVNWPSYSAIDNDGEFAYRLDLPLEVIARDALGSLPNLNSASAYVVELVVADDADVYSTAPDTLPGVRIRAYLNAWSKPSATDPRGNPQMTAPPFERTTQFWTKQTASVNSGSQLVKLSRVGNFIRHVGVIFRDTNGAREGDGYSSSLALQLDGQTLFNEASLIRRDTMAQQYGYALDPITTAGFDEGIVWYSFAHDFDGKPGGELRDLWLPTVQSSRLELEINPGESGSLEFLVNDIAIAAQQG